MSPVQQLQPASPQPAADTATTDDEPDKQQQEQQQEPAEGAGSSQSDSSSIANTAAEQQQQQPSSAVSMLVLCDPRFQQSKQLLAGLDFAFPDAPKVGGGQGLTGACASTCASWRQHRMTAPHQLLPWLLLY
jgi:hypothetical protein